MSHMLKAVKRIEELIDLRKSPTDEEASNEYSIIEAGFLYQQGNILVTYIETKSDVFGNIPALDVPESDESESEEEGAEESQAADKQEESEAKQEKESEPKIEDEAEVAARKKLESLEEEKVPQQSEQKDDHEGNQKDEENQSSLLVEDATENILAAI